MVEHYLRRIILPGLLRDDIRKERYVITHTLEMRDGKCVWVETNKWSNLIPKHQANFDVTYLGYSDALECKCFLINDLNVEDNYIAKGYFEEDEVC